MMITTIEALGGGFQRTPEEDRKKYYVIALPRIETRYSGQWRDWVKNYSVQSMRESEIEVLGTDKRYDDLLPTEFLNYRDYFGYVFPQMVEVIKKVKDGDIVFFMDGETAGVEAFEYLRKMEGIEVEIRTFWHAGTYDSTDLTAVRGVKGEDFERGWFDITDKVYVSSDYHRRLLHEARDVPLSKITVTGCPIDTCAFLDGKRTAKKRKFLYAGRKSPEKGYDIVKSLQSQGVDIAVSLDNQWSKEEFYREIAQSEAMISPAKQETFGIAMTEGFASNVPVIVPDTENYRGLVPEKYRIPWKSFSDRTEFLAAAERVLSETKNDDTREIAAKYDYMNVIRKWLE